MYKRPSPHLLAFRTAYLKHGNATLAAKEAGYKHPGVISVKLSRHPIVVAALRAQQEIALDHAIATRLQRQEFWTKVMLDITADMNDRLKASELLGKSEADFTEKHQISGQDGNPIILCWENSNVGQDSLPTKIPTNNHPS